MQSGEALEQPGFSTPTAAALDTDALMRRAKKLTTEPERFFRDSRYGVVRNIGKLIW